MKHARAGLKSVCVVATAAALLAAAAAVWATAMLGQVQFWGHFKRLLHSGDAGAKVQFADLALGPGVYAVGALAELRGEVIIWDGRVRVSRGDRDDGGTESNKPGDAATLLALTQVRTWQPVPVTRELDQSAFERFVVERAREIGVDADKPFAFAVRGTALDLKWHVLNGKAGSGAHSKGPASSRIFASARSDGLLLGFYSADALEGVITHPGERFHLHWASEDLARSGHVDAYRVAAGAVLLLPPSAR